MFRILFSMFFWVIVARWGYEEIKLYSPETIPHVDRLLERLTPATHNHWPEVSIERSEDGFRLKIHPKSSVTIGKESPHDRDSSRTYSLISDEGQKLHGTTLNGVARRQLYLTM